MTSEVQMHIAYLASIVRAATTTGNPSAVEELLEGGDVLGALGALGQAIFEAGVCLGPDQQDVLRNLIFAFAAPVDKFASLGLRPAPNRDHPTPVGIQRLLTQLSEQLTPDRRFDVADYLDFREWALAADLLADAVHEAGATLSDSQKRQFVDVLDGMGRPASDYDFLGLH